MSLWRGKDPLILASQSRARQALLANAGIEFEAVAAEIDERAVQQASSLSAPGDIAALLGMSKHVLAADEASWAEHHRHVLDMDFIQSHTTGTGVSARSWVMSSIAIAISEIAPTSSHL